MVRSRTFHYFAYGSNMWLPRMVARCPSAAFLRTATLQGWERVYDKPSIDGSAKLNIRPRPGASVPGVIYRIRVCDRALLDAAEPAYTPMLTELGLTYVYDGQPTTALPYAWYVAMVEAGALWHGLVDATRPTMSTTLAPPVD